MLQLGKHVFIMIRKTKFELRVLHFPGVLQGMITSGGKASRSLIHSYVLFILLTSPIPHS